MDYNLSFFISFILSFLFTPIFRFIAKKLNILDYPISDIKTHKEPVPYLGGLAISLSFLLVLILIRLTTNFPTGTLRSLRGIFFGSIIILLIGFIDDVKPKGLHFITKLISELIMSFIVISYGIKIEFIHPDWFSIFLTCLWIVGITNAFNIIDVIDGLSCSVALVSSLIFFVLGTVGDKEVYVNYATISLAGACLGFLPYNLSKKYKIFMGDTGSLFIGFTLSTIALGTRYSKINPLGVITPIIVLLIPIYDTFLVSFLRLRQGKSPFLGSKDHFALRLEYAGFRRKIILLISVLFNILLGVISYIFVTSDIYTSTIIILILTIVVSIITSWIMKIKVE